MRRLLREDFEIQVEEYVRGTLQTPPRAFVLRNVDIGSRPNVSESFESEVYSEVRSRHTLESVKWDPVFRAYRDFYWRIGIDPTKVRPSSEALVRRILQNKPLPRINPLVDVCNLVSALTGITFSVFDLGKLSGSLALTWSRTGEVFRGIGVVKAETLTGKELVMRDEEGVISVYPYRDSERTKTDHFTKDALIVLCCVPAIGLTKLLDTERVLLEAIERELFKSQAR
ncbi:MAG: phenylalanine--tRNA ligase beta subunit-related protein [Thaumarchaeota archaeon]|nr:phenylalanine--tRNA ligase beta subunit-related protein [Candidatus Calditenuaceae archaeon]MDW8041306.1 phenylalanine--tRNA ligase beta subunit-related protein [Nitrososphaerota archaeon]